MVAEEGWSQLSSSTVFNFFKYYNCHVSIFLEMNLNVPGDAEDHLLECSVLNCRSVVKK